MYVKIFFRFAALPSAGIKLFYDVVGNSDGYNDVE
jgi:hypothetical protein